MSLTQLTIVDNLATLNADCTFPEHRNMGIQKALVESRMAIVAQNGIKMARVYPEPCRNAISRSWDFTSVIKQ